MKLVMSLCVIALISFCVYRFTLALTKTKKDKKENKRSATLRAFAVCIVLLGALGAILYKEAKAPDLQCGTVHTTTSLPPSSVTSAMDYYEQGNYDYETGNCQKAITDYTHSIELNPNFPQAYNNRAYTFMRMRDYAAALPDLDSALQLKPDYIQALMNRGDIHNYYFQIDRPSAVKDYEKVIALGGNQKETSVCGHLLLARNNGWTVGAFLSLPRTLFMGSCK